MRWFLGILALVNGGAFVLMLLTGLTPGGSDIQIIGAGVFMTALAVCLGADWRHGAARGDSRREKAMRALAVVAALALSGCSMTPEHRKWTGIVAGALIVGAVIAHEQDSGKLVMPTAPTPGVDCSPNPELCR